MAESAESLRGVAIFNDLIHSVANTIHHPEIREFSDVCLLVGRWRPVELFRQFLGRENGRHAGRKIRPAIVHKVGGLTRRMNDMLEILPSRLLPSMLGHVGVVGAGLHLAPRIDGRRCALEHELLFRPLGDLGNDLNRRSTGTRSATFEILETESNLPRRSRGKLPRICYSMRGNYDSGLEHKPRGDGHVRRNGRQVGKQVRVGLHHAEDELRFDVLVHVEH